MPFLAGFKLGQCMYTINGVFLKTCKLCRRWVCASSRPISWSTLHQTQGRGCTVRIGVLYTSENGTRLAMGSSCCAMLLGFAIGLVHGARVVEKMASCCSTYDAPMVRTLINAGSQRCDSAPPHTVALSWSCAASIFLSRRGFVNSQYEPHAHL